LCLCIYILTIVIHNICCTIFINYQTISFQPKLAYNICFFTFRCCDVRCDFCIKQCSIRLFFQLFLGGILSYLRYLSLFAYSGVEQLLCSVFALFSFVLCTLCCQFLWIVHLSLSFIYWIFFLLLNKIADSFLTNFSNVIKRIFKAKMFQFISIPLQIINYANGMRI
jgi:hypothetical protein